MTSLGGKEERKVPCMPVCHRAVVRTIAVSQIYGPFRTALAGTAASWASVLPEIGQDFQEQGHGRSELAGIAEQHP